MNKIVNPLKHSMQGDAVGDLHQALDKLGFAIPVFERTAQSYHDYTEKAVRDFQHRFDLESTGVVDESTAEKLNEVFSETSVTGRVFTSQGVALPNVRVIAFDKFVGGEQILGEAITDASGAYTIRYNLESFLGEGKKPDIQIKVTQSIQSDKTLAVSTVHYDTDSSEAVNVVAPIDDLEQSSEYEQIATAMGEQLRETNTKRKSSRDFSQLQENEERQDITYLADKTGWDARMVAMVALSDQLSEESDIAPEFYYALLRAGVSSDKDGVYQTSADNAVNVWRKAIDNNTLPKTLEAQIDEAEQIFKEVGTNHLLGNTNIVGVSPVADMLSLGLDSSKHAAFVQMYFNHQGDMATFWSAAESTFGKSAINRVRLVGKLGYLTVDNAGLITKLQQANYVKIDPVDLVRNGLYTPEAWEALISDGIQIPKEVIGKNEEEKKRNYANYMAHQLKISYPTAVVAELVNSDDLAIEQDDSLKASVYNFLSSHQGNFELGVQPLTKYLRDNNIDLAIDVKDEIQRIQRLYQISLGDEAMIWLSKNNFDSAYSVMQFDEREFIDNFKVDLGGEEAARMTYAKANQIHSTGLSLATSYLTFKTNPRLYVLSGGQAEDESGADAIPNPDAIPNATLEALFGEMDFCSCEHCRSVLSPAAYLVDLLQFIDTRKTDRKGNELAQSSGNAGNPFEALRERRPDIEHIQLTCENTNTVLPYIDLVNEILEYYVTATHEGDEFSTYRGHNIDEEITTEELLANPQHVEKDAYTILKGEVYPLSLPFNRSLEATREYFKHLGVSLHDAMEKLRVNDNLDVDISDPNPPPYGWRDIALEYLGISKEEREIFTNSSTRELPEYFGMTELPSNAKTLARTVGITFKELLEIIKTRFINPNNHLITKLDKLGVSLTQIRQFQQTEISAKDFENLLPNDLDEAAYGGDVVKWVQDNFANLGRLILLTPSGEVPFEECDFGLLELKYAFPSTETDNNTLKPIEYWKLFRFIRLWRKLGWSIADTDKAITALYSKEASTTNAATDDITELDKGFDHLLIKLAHVKRTLNVLKLTVKGSLIKLLTLWSTIDTNGSRSLYHELFLHSSLSELNENFKEDGYGNYLKNDQHKLFEEASMLKAALNLTDADLKHVLSDLGFNEKTALSLDNVSSVYRYAFLARALRLSIRDFIALKEMSGIDPFHELEPIQPSTLAFLENVRLIQDSEFSVQELRFLFQHSDETGQGSPPLEESLALANTLRDELTRIDLDHAVQDDPTGSEAQSKMALIYGEDVAAKFFGLLTDTSTYSAEYSHSQSELENEISKVNADLGYDDLRKELIYKGIMTLNEKEVLIDLAGTSADFKDSVAVLFDAAQNDFAVFFEQYPELASLYSDFVASEKTIDEALETFLPIYREQIKRLFVKQTLASLLDAELSLVNTLLEGQLADGKNYILHAEGAVNEPAVVDFLNLTQAGVSAQYFFRDRVAGKPDVDKPAVSAIRFTGDPGYQLPVNDTDNEKPISARWRFYLNPPANGNYNFYLDTDQGAEVNLRFNGEEMTMSNPEGDAHWRNEKSISLKAGKPYAVELVVLKVSEKAVLKWKSDGIAKDFIPPEYLFPHAVVGKFAATYIRLLKSVLFSAKMGFSAKAVQYVSDHRSLKFSDVDPKPTIGLLNKLPSTSTPPSTIVKALFIRAIHLLNLGELRASLSTRDDQIFDVLLNPGITNAQGETLLSKITGWEENVEKALMQHFRLKDRQLGDWNQLRRVQNAVEIVNRTGVSVGELLTWLASAEDEGIVQEIQNGLRAKYDQSAWLDALQPINDKLRALQREALVAYVLHKMHEAIDTPDKLFEYFLIDIEMDPCMKTSRIKQAISSVQLFVQRSLMNLEPSVSPSSINADQWEWMKRYRVWEANRKVFLYPENWLEPELRDNKSPFFKNLESELLQADITEDMAHKALAHYLEKLDEVAKLEICGMYLQENNAAKRTDDVLHVFGRTPGANRKYFHRRFEGGYWTPWEAVELDIEDNPILPVVWNNRLFLFWLNMIVKGEASKQKSNNGNKDLVKMTADDFANLPGDTKIRVEANLSWSEYYNDKWQPRMTSDFDDPVRLGNYQLRHYERRGIWLGSNDKKEEELQISIGNTFGKVGIFKLSNRHSAPISERIDSSPDYPEAYYRSRDRYSSKTGVTRKFLSTSGLFRVSSFDRDDKNLLFQYHILKSSTLYHRAGDYSIEPRNPVNDIYRKPFCVQDDKHVFFVSPKVGSPLVKDYLYLGNNFPYVDLTPEHPELWIQPDPFFMDNLLGDTSIDPQEPIFPDSPVVNGRIKRAIRLPGTVDYAGVTIGTAGSSIDSNVTTSILRPI